MERHTFYTDTPWLLLCLALMALVWAFLQLPKEIVPPKPPTPVPPAVALPACQQDNQPHPDGARYTSDIAKKSDGTPYFAQVLPDLTDRRYDRVVTDQVVLSNRFDAGSVGPIVFRPDGQSLAFIAAQNGQKYILGYSSGSLTPYAAERIRGAWNHWICFGETGTYLFALTQDGDRAYLSVRPEQARAGFTHYLLNGDPARVQVLPVRVDAGGGGQFAPVDAAVQLEVNRWIQ